MIKLEKSPIKNRNLEPLISCKDYTVSQETFSIYIDRESELLITNPQPKEEDLGKYYESEEYISHSDTKKSLVDKLYHWVRNYTIKKKIKLINSFNSEEKTILDIGAGTGDFLEACVTNGWKAIGVEPNQKASAIANSKIGNKKFPIYKSIDTLKQKGKFVAEISKSSKAKLEIQNSKLSFDIITMWHVLEHVPNLNEYVANLKSLLKPNGTLIVAVPNYKSYDANHYKEFWAAYDVPRHLWHFSQKAISDLFAQKNMTVEKVLPMKFDAFYVSLLSEKYKTGKSNLFKAFWVGYVSNRRAKTSKEYSSLIYIIKNS